MLTVMATLSVPILVITSYYGMNIAHFPPLTWPAMKANAWILGITGVCTLAVYVLLRRKKWM